MMSITAYIAFTAVSQEMIALELFLKSGVMIR